MNVCDRLKPSAELQVNGAEKCKFADRAPQTIVFLDLVLSETFAELNSCSNTCEYYFIVVQHFACQKCFKTSQRNLFHGLFLSKVGMYDTTKLCLSLLSTLQNKIGFYFL